LKKKDFIAPIWIFNLFLFFNQQSTITNHCVNHKSSITGARRPFAPPSLAGRGEKSFLWKVVYELTVISKAPKMGIRRTLYFEADNDVFI